MANGRRPSLVTIAAALVFMLGLGAASAAFLGPVIFPDNGEGGQATPTASTVPIDQVAAQEAVDNFAAALEAGDLSPITFAATTPAVATAAFTNATTGLGTFALAAAPGEVGMVGDRVAQAPLSLTWTFPGAIAWSTSTNVTAEEIDGRWRVRWEASIIEPTLVAGDELRRDRIAAQRAEVLGRDGSILVSDANFVRIGIRPSRVQDLPVLVGQLEGLLAIDPADVTARVGAAGPDEFVDVALVPRADYEAIREQIFPLPGTVFEEQIRPTAGDASLARALLGRSGEVTAEVIEANPDLFVPGDYAGLSGLQAAYNVELAGTPGTRISVVRARIDPSSTTTGTGLITTSALRDPTAPEVLATVDPVNGRQVVTTIDPTIQAAAEAALQARPETSALVAIEVSTGEVVAVANGPTDSTVNFALTGQYPPGSIFKIISGYALLTNTLGAEDAVDCPQTITIDGRTFSNAEDEVLGIIPFRSAFAHSCNTAFVGTTRGFGLDTLSLAATEFGVGADTPIGLPAFTGSVPVAENTVDLAASSFGQGRVLLSPMSAAVMAATAADGVYRSPRLITSPSPGPQTSTQLAPDPANTLRALMRAVVTEGTGRAVAGVPGPPVSGKTGTAEFGNQSPPQSHAWFVGYQGNLAFAVFVEAGEFGGSTAAPIAADFLGRLAAPAPSPTTTLATPDSGPATTGAVTPTTPTVPSTDGQSTTDANG